MKRKESKMRVSILCIFLFILLLGCTEKKHEGFNLQNFDIVNPKLQKIVDSISVVIETQKQEEHILVLNLNAHDTIPEFWFMYENSNSICNYIYDNNRRIVGYIKKSNSDIVVLSDINNNTKFGLMFYRFIKPTSNLKRFPYIYFPEHQYVVNKEGVGFPPPFRDYRYLIFNYRNNEFAKIKK